MTVEAWTQTPTYTVAGIGPYAVTHPYVEGAIRVAIIVDDTRIMLNSAEFSMTPLASETTGNLFLSPTAATTHAGRTVVIDRLTPDEQGWLAILGEREAALMAQLDRMVFAAQELREGLKGGLRIREDLDPFDWLVGTVPLRSADGVISGPTADQITAAQARATEAAASAAAAAGSAAEALAKQNSMLRDRGNWTTALLYSPSDIVTINGSAYICILSHLAGVFATDLGAARWRLFAAKGDAGAGTGDMLKTENLSGLTNVPLARTNLSLGALATKTLAAFADFDPAAIISDIETLLANEAVANAVPVAKAVADYVKGKVLPTAPLASWVHSSDVTSISLIGLAGYDAVRLEGYVTASTFFVIQVSPDNGVTWRTSGYTSVTQDGAGDAGATNGFRPSRTSTLATNHIGIDIEGMASATKKTQMRGHSITAPGGARINVGMGVNDTAEICTAIRLTGATFSGGIVHVFADRRA